MASAEGLIEAELFRDGVRTDDEILAGIDIDQNAVAGGDPKVAARN